jgi:flagellar hook-length control protein FliK
MPPVASISAAAAQKSGPGVAASAANGTGDTGFLAALDDIIQSMSGQSATGVAAGQQGAAQQNAGQGGGSQQSVGQQGTSAKAQTTVAVAASDSADDDAEDTSEGTAADLSAPATATPVVATATALPATPVLNVKAALPNVGAGATSQIAAAQPSIHGLSAAGTSPEIEPVQPEPLSAADAATLAVLPSAQFAVKPVAAGATQAASNAQGSAQTASPDASIDAKPTAISPASAVSPSSPSDAVAIAAQDEDVSSAAQPAAKSKPTDTSDDAAAVAPAPAQIDSGLLSTIASQLQGSNPQPAIQQPAQPVADGNVSISAASAKVSQQTATAQNLVAETSQPQVQPQQAAPAPSSTPSASVQPLPQKPGVADQGPAVGQTTQAQADAAGSIGASDSQSQAQAQNQSSNPDQQTAATQADPTQVADLKIAAPVVAAPAEATVEKTKSTDGGVKSIDAAATATPAADASSVYGQGAQITSQVGQAHTAATDASASIAPQSPADQISVVLQRAVTEKTSSVTIALDPAELGKVEVKLDFNKDGSVQANITADRQDTLTLLKNDHAGLHQALQNAGFSTDSSSLSFNLRSDNQNQQAQQGGKAYNARANFMIDGGVDAVASTAATQSTPAAADGRVDVRV